MKSLCEIEICRDELMVLSDICDVYSGYALKEFNESCKGLPVIKIGNIYADGTLGLSDCQYSEETVKDKYYSQRGDIYVALSGATTGKIGIMTSEAKHIVNQRVGIVRKKSNSVPESYIKYFLMRHTNRILEEASGCAQPNISPRQIAQYLMPSHTKEEMIAVVNILDDVSHLIDYRKQELNALDELIKARFVEMFGEGYPEDTLLNLCNIIDYRGKTPEKVESGLPFITAKNIKMHKMSLEPREYISKETYDKVMVRGFPKEGDVVFTTEAPLGNVCRIPHFDTEFYIGQRIVTLQTEKLIPTYLEYAVSTEEFKRKYMGKSSGSTVTGIRVRLLEQLTVPVPPIELQKQFDLFVEQVDKSKVAVKKSLDETQLLFDSLMQEYFG